MPLQTIDISKFESCADSLYEAVMVAAKRARQINDEMKLELAQRLEPVIAKETEDDTIMNQDKFNISVEFEKREKPTNQAIKEMLNNDITYKYRDEE